MHIAHIPERLQKNDYRFTINGDSGEKLKRPIEEGWPDYANYPYNDPKLQEYLRKGYNYGIIARPPLIIIDFDDPRFKLEFEKYSPQTFTDKTKNGYHLFYKIPEPIQNQDFPNESGKKVIELKANRKTVVGPNCRHPSGFIYTIEKDVEIAVWNKKELVIAITNTWRQILGENPPLRGLVSCDSFCSSSVVDVVSRDLLNRGVSVDSQSYLDKNDKFDLEKCYNKEIRIEILSSQPPLSKDPKYIGRRIITFLYENKFHWIELNKTCVANLSYMFGHPFYWNHKQITVISTPYQDGQKGSLTLLIRLNK